MEFFGHDFPLEEYERIAQSLPKADVLFKDEEHLRSRKWFEYRPLHYVAATYLFADEYITAYKHFNKTAIGLHMAYNRGRKGKDFMTSKEKSSYFKCRQKADEMGIEYKFFLRRAMNFCISIGWAQPPRPCHIHSNPDLLIAVANEWDRENRALIRYPDSTFFAVDEWADDPAQAAFEVWLIDQIKMRRHPKFALATALFDKRCLRLEAAKQHFGEALIDEARHYFVQFSK